MSEIEKNLDEFDDNLTYDQIVELENDNDLIDYNDNFIETNVDFKGKTAFERYLSDINTLKKLDISEEKDYFNKYYDLISNYNITHDDKLIYKANLYKEKIINSNLKLVVYIALKLVQSNFDINDLIQEGNEALIKAFDTFDINKNVKFTTYAYHKIYFYLRRYMRENSKIIVLPNAVVVDLSKISKYITTFEAENGFRPSKELIAKHFNFPLVKVEKLLSYYYSDVSLSKVISENADKGTELHEMIYDKSINIIDNIHNEEFKKALNNILDTLDMKKKDIFCMYYGIVSYDKAYSQAQIAKKYNLSRQRINQLINEVLQILKVELKSFNIS